MLKRLVDLYRYRELVKNLVARDLKARYKNSMLGFLWCLVNPLLMMAVFTFVFTVMLPSSPVKNFPVFLLCAVLPWNFFSTAVMSGINSIVGNAHLIKKVYFPWEVLPLSTVLANLVNFLLSLLVLFIFILVYRVGFTFWLLIYLPLVVVVQVIFTLGISMILATVNVFYRDTAVIMEVLLLAWFFVTPIFYPIDILPTHRQIFGIDWAIHRLTYIVNPMASIISAYRDILYGSIGGGPPRPPALDFLGRTAITAMGVLVVGYLVFCHYSKVFAEEV